MISCPVTSGLLPVPGQEVLVEEALAGEERLEAFIPVASGIEAEIQLFLSEKDGLLSRCIFYLAARHLEDFAHHGGGLAGGTVTKMETAIQVFAILNLGIIGLSHLFRPKAWIQFFILLREQGEAGVFAVGFLSLLFGSLIVSFHSVWTGIPAVLTLLGWAQILKALIYFTLPAVGLRNLHSLSPAKVRHFQTAGVLLLALASLLIFHLWVSP